MIRSLARLTAAGLIVLATAAFAIGVSLERHSEAAEHAVQEPPAASNPTSQVRPTSLTPVPTSAATSTASPSPTSTTPDTDQRSDHDADHGGDGDADHGGDSDQDHPAATTTTTTGAATTTLTPGAAAGQGAGDADGTHDQDADGGHEDGSGQAVEAAKHSELVFGLNLESTPLVTAAVVVSLLFAAAILTLGMPWLAGVIAVAMLAFAALDVREIVHQLGESRLELAAVAIVAALLHALAAIAAAHVARTRHLRGGGATGNSM